MNEKRALDWTEPDDLELVWRIVGNSGPQDKAFLLSYISKVTKDQLGLQQAIAAWEGSANLHESTKSEIGYYTVATCLEFDQLDQAFQIATSIENEGRHFSALYDIYRHTHGAAVLTMMRDEVEQIENELLRVKLLGRIALASAERKDFLHAQESLGKIAQYVRHSDLSWMKANQVKSMLVLNEVDQAKALASELEGDALIYVLWQIACFTRSRLDLIALKQRAAPNTLRQLRQVVDAHLVCGEIDLARQYTDGRLDRAERCNLFGLISMHGNANEDDLNKAIRAYLKIPYPFRANQVETRPQLVYAFSRWGQYEEAHAFASKVYGNRQQGLAYLSVHNAKIGNASLSFEQVLR